MRTPGHFGQGPEVGVVIDDDGDVEDFFDTFLQVQSHPFGQDGSLGDRSAAAVDGAGDAHAGTDQGAAVEVVLGQQFGDEPSCCGDAFFALVPEGENDRSLGDDVVIQRGEDHAQVATAEVDADPDGPVVEESHVQGSASRTGGGLGVDEAGGLHELHDIGDGGRGQPGLPGEFGLGGGAGEQAIDQTLLVQMAQRGLRPGTPSTRL